MILHRLTSPKKIPKFFWDFAIPRQQSFKLIWTSGHSAGQDWVSASKDIANRSKQDRTGEFSRRSRFTIVEMQKTQFLEKACPSQIYMKCNTFRGVFALLWAAPAQNRDRNLLGMSLEQPKMPTACSGVHQKSLKSRAQFRNFGAKLTLIRSASTPSAPLLAASNNL